MAFLTAPADALRSDVLGRIVAATKYWSEDQLAALLAVFHQRSRPLPTDIAFLIAEHDPRSPRSVVSHRHREKFQSLFAQRYRSHFGDGLVLRAAKRDAYFEYRPASETLLHLWYDQPLRNIRLPNVVGLSSQFKPLIEVWSSAVEDLRAFDRVHRKSGGAEMTAEMYEALPAELRQEDHPDFDRWYSALNQYANDEGWTLVPIRELAMLRGITERKRLTRKQSEDLLRSADAMYLCIEPDTRETGQNYHWDELVSVFPREQDGAANLRSYHAASILLRLGMTVASADGAVDAKEVAVITKHLEQQFELTPQDSLRLDHLAYLLTHTTINETPIAKKLAHLPEAQRQIIGAFLVGIAAADEVVTPEEVRALKRSYRSLGLDVNDLDRLAVGHVRAADAAPDTDDELILDHDRIRAIMSETAKVAEFLKSVMLDDEEGKYVSAVASKPVPTEIAPPRDRPSAGGVGETKSAAPKVASASQAGDNFNGLDKRYHAFLECLLAKAEWSREALAAAARDHHVMLRGAIEAINEWSLDRCGDWLVDDSGDVVAIQSDLLTAAGIELSSVSPKE